MYCFATVLKLVEVVAGCFKTFYPCCRLYWIHFFHNHTQYLRIFIELYHRYGGIEVYLYKGKAMSGLMVSSANTQ